MKRWYYFALAAVAVAAIIYVYSHWGGQTLGSMFNDDGKSPSGPPGRMRWHTLERPGDGFKVDLPAEEKDRQVPAFNEAGGTEMLRMIEASPTSDITFALAWDDNPPVARVNRTAEHTLNMARDGMLARTDTTIVSESRGFHRDYPSLDVLANNTGGGILNARLVLVDRRLYTLLALYPNASSRREKDVKRFFDSFVPAASGDIPETMPSASQ